ncbi:MAG: site-specific integrase [Nitrosarchaeum sp.]|nr:site-specific integrase [Nitrosarchaeum sp.]
MTESNCENLIQNFLDSVYVLSHSKNSTDVYRTGIKHFTKFVQEQYQKSLKDIISAIKEEQMDKYQILKDFVIYLDKAGKKPASIKIWVVGTKGFLKHSGIKIYHEDFKMTVRLPKRVQQREEPLTKEIILRIFNNVSAKIRTIILVATASGMRIGEIIQLKLSDVDFDSKPTKIRIRADITKTRESRETFLTVEATNSLKDYLTRFFEWKEDESNKNLQDLLIFSRTSKSYRKSNNDRKKTPQQNNSSILINSMKRHIENIPELSRLNENGRHMVHFHAFRKYFRTVVGNAVGRDYAEALMGHHFYLDTYYNLPEEKKREMYLQAEPFLTISDYARIEKDLHSVKQRQKQIEEKQLDLIQLINDDHMKLPASLQKYLQ